MTPEYAVGLLGLAASLCAVAALVWAVGRRQLRTDDQAMYESVADDEPDYAATPTGTPVPRRTVWVFAAVFTALFGLVVWMIVQTVRVATHTPPRPLTASELKSGK